MNHHLEAGRGSSGEPSKTICMASAGAVESEAAARAVFDFWQGWMLDRGVPLSQRVPRYLVLWRTRAIPLEAALYLILEAALCEAMAQQPEQERCELSKPSVLAPILRAWGGPDLASQFQRLAWMDWDVILELGRLWVSRSYLPLCDCDLN